MSSLVEILLETFLETELSMKFCYNQFNDATKTMNEQIVH